MLFGWTLTFGTPYSVCVYVCLGECESGCGCGCLYSLPLQVNYLGHFLLQSSIKIIFVTVIRFVLPWMHHKILRLEYLNLTCKTPQTTISLLIVQQAKGNKALKPMQTPSHKGNWTKKQQKQNNNFKTEIRWSVSILCCISLCWWRRGGGVVVNELKGGGLKRDGGWKNQVGILWAI